MNALLKNTLITAAFAGLACFLAVAACGNVKTVTIRVKTPPDIDPSLFKRVAVLPFDGDDDEECFLTAKAVLQGMEKKGEFVMEPDDTVQAMLDRLDYYDASSRNDVLALGKDLGADLVVYGNVRFFSRTYSEEGDVHNELYTADRQTIPPFELGSAYSTRDLNIRVKYTMQLTVKAMAVTSGRLVRRREFERTTSESYNQTEMASSPRKQREIFDNLLSSVVDDFVYALETHDVAAERTVAKF
jgi:hypothetical protein